MKLLTHNVKLSTAVAAMIAGAVALPVTADSQRGFQLNPGIGHIQYDSQSDLNNGGFGFLGLEYLFGNGIALEGSYLINGTEDNSSPTVDTDVSIARLDGHYYFGDGNNFQPYLSLGLGNAKVDFNNTDTSETVYNGGFGVRHYLGEKLSLRADARYFEGKDSKQETTTTTLTLSYLLGGKKDKPMPAPPVVEMVKAPTDSDNDGITDDFDQCSGTGAGVAVDARGCALDSDSDGLADSVDKCPNTPTGAKIDEMGCEIPVIVQGAVDSLEDLSAAIAAGNVANAADVNLDVKFGNNKSFLTAEYLPEIEKLANFLKGYQSASVVIEGHSDSSGNADYNQALSAKRAKHIMQLLVERFQVPANRLTAVGVGDTQPIASNSTREGRALNRRVTASISTAK